MQIDGRTALVTGATGGIGHAIARALHARGARLLLTGRRAEVLEPLAAEVDGRAIASDHTERAALDRLIEEIAEVDILVANAALPGSGRLTDLDVERIDRALDVNLRAPILLARALVPRMVERGQGHLVFVNSLSGKTASVRTGIYAATKFGLRGFARCLRQDLHGTGVGVSSVFPGFIREAGMFADAHVKLPAGVGTNSPADVADAVVRSIEGNVAEIDVAPLAMRLGTRLAAVAPGFVESAQRWSGAEKFADELVEGQRGKA